MKPDQAIPASVSLVPIHLLLVEDNPGDARLVQEMLRDQPHFKMETVVCLAACMARLESRGIDLVLLDLGLGDSQGLDTLTSVARAFPSLPIVSLTGLDDEALAVRTVQAGGQDYLTKNTVTSEILRRTVRHAIERKHAEEKLIKSLAEKEVLLKEVHHRVKNNLMTIIGLIKMQQTKADNKLFTTLLLELEGRIRSMALVHECLHKSDDLAHVELQNYIETMSPHICAQFGKEQAIRFWVQAARVEVDLDVAVPCGLILNELIGNAYEHAFPEGTPGSGSGHCEISVVIRSEGDHIMLTVADNGIGLPRGMNWKNPETLGLRLVKMLSEQLNGSLEMKGSPGSVFRLIFPNPAHERN